MKLTPEQQAVLDGSKGAVMAKVMKTLVMYGDAFGAEKMVPVTSTYGHTVISFGINAMKPVYDLYDQLIEAGAFSEQKFTADPLPLDKNVPSNPLQDLVFRQFMYKQQARYEAQLRKLGILSDKDYTCTCYLDEVGNKPKQGEVLVGGVVRRGVRQQRARRALQPQLRHDRAHGLYRRLRAVFRFPDRRRAKGRLDRRGAHDEKARAAAARLCHRHEGHGKVPYVKGLDQWIGTEINEDAIAYLKDFGAATASNGAVGLYHIEHLTPGGRAAGRGAHPRLCARVRHRRRGAPARARKLSVRVEEPQRKLKLCFMGCPHMTLHQLIDTTERVEATFGRNGQRKVCIPTVFTAAPGVIVRNLKRQVPPCNDPASQHRRRPASATICPPRVYEQPARKARAMPVITSSNKLRRKVHDRAYCAGG